MLLQCTFATVPEEVDDCQVHACNNFECAPLFASFSAYGLANAPRVRFLSRTAKEKKKLNSQRSREKSKIELVEMAQPLKKKTVNEKVEFFIFFLQKLILFVSELNFD